MGMQSFQNLDNDNSACAKRATDGALVRLGSLISLDSMVEGSGNVNGGSLNFGKHNRNDVEEVGYKVLFQCQSQSVITEMMSNSDM